MSYQTAVVSVCFFSHFPAFLEVILVSAPFSCTLETIKKQYTVGGRSGVALDQ